MSLDSQSYLRTLLADLATPFSDHAPYRPLRPITARAWNGNARCYFRGGKLSLANNLFADQAEGASDERGWEEEQSFVAQLMEKRADAGKFTYYYLAQVWASRRAAADDEYLTLFDDNRLKTAQAVCDAVEPNDYLYVKGAINGIQRFIYDNVKAEQIGEAEKVSRRLRGRSFLVAILGELIAEYLVIDQLDLERANILFIGGGHFNLLLPRSIEADLDAHIWRINEGFLSEFGLSLSINLGAEPMGQLAEFTDVFLRANDQLERKKSQQYKGHLNEVFFAGTGKTTAPKSTKNYTATPAVQAAEEAGRWLPKAKFMLEVTWSHVPPEYPFANASCLHSKTLGKTLVFLRRPPRTTDIDSDWQWLDQQMRHTDWEWQSESRYRLYRLNDTDFLPPRELQSVFLERPLGFGYRLIGLYAPAKENLAKRAAERDHIIELGELAQLSNEADERLNFDRIAAMRLDLDDLGATFAYGLGPASDIRRTFALSRELQQFFGGYFNMLAQKHQIYIVYSGGDDAFVLGSWWNVLYFALDLHQDFRRFTQGNQHLSLSAGIILNHPNYPIARLANDAGEEEKVAKHFQQNGELVKNAIRVFGHTMSWPRFVEMMAVSEELLDEVKTGSSGLRRSALQHLLAVISAAEYAKKPKINGGATDDFFFYRQLGRLHAIVTRRKVNKSNPIVEKLLQEMATYERFRDYLLPFHYVLYKTR